MNRRVRILSLFVVVSGLAAAEAHADSTVAPGKHVGKTPVTEASRAKAQSRARLLGVTLSSYEVLVAAARNPKPTRLRPAERALLSRIVQGYRAGNSTAAAALLRNLTRDCAKRDPEALPEIVNHLVWAVVIESDPVVQRMVVGTAYLEQKKEALARQAADLRAQLENTKGSMLQLKSKRFAMGKDGSLSTTTAIRRVARSAVEAELARVERQLAGTVAALHKIRQAFAGSTDVAVTDAVTDDPAPTKDDPAPTLDDAVSDELNDALGSENDDLVLVYASLAVIDQASAAVHDVQRSAEAAALLIKCNAGETAACIAYEQLLQEFGTP
jgi:hypothetical protein